MTDLHVTAVGVLAAVITTASWMPQVIRTWRRRSARDFSWVYLALFATGTTLWLVYGILRRDAAVIGANGVTVLLVLGIAWIKGREL